MKYGEKITLLIDVQRKVFLGFLVRYRMIFYLNIDA